MDILAAIKPERRRIENRILVDTNTVGFRLAMMTPPGCSAFPCPGRQRRYLLILTVQWP
jgi:hypothetical protein